MKVIHIERDHEWLRVNSYEEPERVWCKWCGEERQVVYSCRPDLTPKPSAADQPGAVTE